MHSWDLNISYFFAHFIVRHHFAELLAKLINIACYFADYCPLDVMVRVVLDVHWQVTCVCSLH